MFIDMNESETWLQDSIPDGINPEIECMIVIVEDGNRRKSTIFSYVYKVSESHTWSKLGFFFLFENNMVTNLNIRKISIN